MTEEEKKAKKSSAKPAAKKADAKKADDKKAPAKKAAAKPTAKKSDAKAEKKPAAKKADKKASSKKADSGVKKQGKLIDNVDLYDVIERPLITEKSTMAAEQNKVVFKISPSANKSEVKQAVEAMFGVKVTKVNTILTKGKTKKFRGQNGRRSDQRKAIVTLAEGQSIDIAAGLK